MSDFDDDFGDDGFEDDDFMDEEPFDDDLTGEELCHEELFEDEIPDDEISQDEPGAPLTDVSGGPDWEDIAFLGAMSEEIAEERKRRAQILREMEKRNKKP